MRVGVPNDLPYLFAIGYVERQGKNSVTKAFREIGNIG